MVICAHAEDPTATRDIEEQLGDEQRLTLLTHGSAENSGGLGDISVKPLATEVMTMHGEIHNVFSFLHHLHIAISCTVSGAIVAVLTAAGCWSVEFIWQCLGSLTVKDGTLSGALWVSPTCCLCATGALWWRLCTDHAQQSDQPREAALHVRSRYWFFYAAPAILAAMLAWPSCNNVLESRTGGVWRAEWTMIIVKGFHAAVSVIVSVLFLAWDDDALKLKRESNLSDEAPLKTMFALVPKDGSFLRWCAFACYNSLVIGIKVGLFFEAPFILTMFDLPRYAKSLSLTHSPLTRLALTVAAPVALREMVKTVFRQNWLNCWNYGDTVNETPPAFFIHICIAVNAWGEFLAKWSIYASIGIYGSDLWHIVVLMIGQNAFELIHAAVARTVPMLHAYAKTAWLSASRSGYSSDETERIGNEEIRKVTFAAAVNRDIAHRMEYLSHSAAAAVLLMREDSQSAQKQVVQVWALGILLELATDAVRNACIDTESINLHLDPNFRFQLALLSCEFCALCMFDATM